MDEIFCAIRDGAVERTVAVLSRGAVGIDQGDPSNGGLTPLMFAAYSGHSRVVKILLNKGANVAKVACNGSTALRMSAQKGHMAATKLLLKAGADLEAAASDGSTPLQLAVGTGQSEIARVMIEAGANVNSRLLNGATPLYNAAQDGHLDAIKVLLRERANPLLTFLGPSGRTTVPLDAAAHQGHVEAVHELIREYGIEGCGGASGGVDSLELATQNQHVGIMASLTSAGVVDNGFALGTAVLCGSESSVKFLLLQWKQNSGDEGAAYLETRDRVGRTPMLCSIEACSPRITRLLVDAGADTTTAVRLLSEGLRVSVLNNPLAMVELLISKKIIKGADATEAQLNSLEGTRRLLMRVEAVHAFSWLWVNDVPFATYAVAKYTGKTKVSPTPLILMLPILRRRAGRPRVLFAALFRNSKKP